MVLGYMLLCLQDAKATEKSTNSLFSTCMENVDLSAMKNTQWLVCYLDEFYRKDKILNQKYNELINRIPDDSKSSLSKAQRSWISFRDNWCSFEEQLPMAPTSDVNKAACLLELTIEQIKRLQNEY